MLATTCAFCDAYSHFTVRSGAIIGFKTVHISKNLPAKTLAAVDVAATCDSCGRFSTVHGRYEVPDNRRETGPVGAKDAIKFAEVMTEMQWQPPAMIQPSTEFVPHAVAGFLIEAHNANAIRANRAVLLLVRSIIEATAREKGVMTGKLLQKIDALSKQGIIRDGVKDMAHALRILGNEIAHGEIDHVPSDEDAADALTVVGMILDDVYVADAKRVEMLSRRDARRNGETDG